MIGNDIVDLKAAAKQSNWRRRGYLQKVFTEEEQKLINQVQNPEFFVWLFWSMKEAAYKAQQREFDLKRSFNPSKIACEIRQIDHSSASGKVTIGHRIYITKTEYKNLFIHTTAAASETTSIISRIYPSSSEIKELLIEEISSFYRLPKSIFRIEKDRNSIPVLTREYRPTGYSFSISHHGKYKAFSLPLMKD